EVAHRLTQQAKKGLVTLANWIDTVSLKNKIPVDLKGIKEISEIHGNTNKEALSSKGRQPFKIEIKNGLLVVEGKIMTGTRIENPWWRGSLRPRDLKNNLPHITRFVPGKFGRGFTDNLEDVVEG